MYFPMFDTVFEVRVRLRKKIMFLFCQCQKSSIIPKECTVWCNSAVSVSNQDRAEGSH